MPVAHFLLGCLFLNDLLFFYCLLLLCLYMVSVFGPAKPLLQFLSCGMGPGSFLAFLDLVHGALCLLVLMGSCPLQQEVGGLLAETFACLPERLPSDS